MTRTRSERPQGRQRIYRAGPEVIVITCVGQAWRMVGLDAVRISRGHAARLLRQWKAGAR